MNSTAAQLSAVVNTYHGGRAVFQQLYTQVTILGCAADVPVQRALRLRARLAT